jgi:hypothetical protein
MEYKRTLLHSLAVIVLLLLSGSAFALQDTTLSRGKRVNGNPRIEPAQAVSDESSDTITGDDEYSDEEYSNVQPVATDPKESHASKEYLSRELSKHPANKASWGKAARGIDYSDEEEEKEQERKAPNLPNLSVPAFGGAWLQVVLFAVIGLALAFLLYKLLGGSFVSNKKIGNGKVFSIEDIEDQMHESDLDKFLREALEKGDYRLAVRIYYLAIIKELSLRDWISWKKDKTNREYLNEMMGHKPELYGGFREATYAFEKVWYGDLDIRRNDFDMISPRFKNLIDSIRK